MQGKLQEICENLKNYTVFKESIKNKRKEAAFKDTKAKKNDQKEKEKEQDIAAAYVAVAPEATAEKADVAAIEVKDQESEYIINYAIAKKIMTDMSDELKEIEKKRAEINKNLDGKRSAIVQVAGSMMAAAKTKNRKVTTRRKMMKRIK